MALRKVCCACAPQYGRTFGNSLAGRLIVSVILIQRLGEATQTFSLSVPLSWAEMRKVGGKD